MKGRGDPSDINYVEANIGDPPFLVNLAFDTVNPLTWVQSAECTRLLFPFKRAELASHVRAWSTWQEIYDPPNFGTDAFVNASV